MMEVLISFVIMTFISLVASLSISLFLDNWGKDRLGQRRDIHNFQYFVLLQDAIEGAYDYYVKSSKKGDERVPYFRTSDNGFAFVTSNPFWSDGEVALARVLFKKEGSFFSLIYEEASLRDKYLVYAGEEVSYERSISVLENIHSFSIQYYGAQDLTTSGLFHLELDNVMNRSSNSEVYQW